MNRAQKHFLECQKVTGITTVALPIPFDKAENGYLTWQDNETGLEYQVYPSGTWSKQYSARCNLPHDEVKKLCNKVSLKKAKEACRLHIQDIARRYLALEQ